LAEQTQWSILRHDAIHTHSRRNPYASEIAKALEMLLNVMTQAIHKPDAIHTLNFGAKRRI
jgi:hypothetical protein